MSIQHTTAENSPDAGKTRDREWSWSAIVTNNTLADAWLNGNRETIESNTFFPFAIEPGPVVKATPDLRRHKWIHRQPIPH